MAAMTGFWSAATYPELWSSAKIEGVSSQIASGESFKRDILVALRPQIVDLEKQIWPTPESLHSIALIELRLAELDMLDGELISKDPQFARAQAAITEALRFAPSDAFMWFALFWLIKTRDGFSPALIPYLRMSYLTGPNEGWIAVSRNRVALPLLSNLPEDLAAVTVAEFRSLVETPAYVADAADILTGPGWAYHELLIKSLVNSPDDSKQQLDDAVYNLGFNITIPGTKPRGLRPWR